MRSIPYSDIEKGVAAIAGIDPTSLLAHEKVLLAEYISDATKYCWDYYPWSEFTKTEKRYFRNAFVPSTSYKAGDEVYYDGKYYRCSIKVPHLAQLAKNKTTNGLRKKQLSNYLSNSWFIS